MDPAERNLAHSGDLSQIVLHYFLSCPLEDMGSGSGLARQGLHLACKLHLAEQVRNVTFFRAGNVKGGVRRFLLINKM